MVEELENATWCCVESEFLHAARVLSYDNIWNSYISQTRFREITHGEYYYFRRYDGGAFEFPLPNGKALKVIHGCKLMKQLSKKLRQPIISSFWEFRIAHFLWFSIREI